jgi:hypothetical protein
MNSNQKATPNLGWLFFLVRFMGQILAYTDSITEMKGAKEAWVIKLFGYGDTWKYMTHWADFAFLRIMNGKQGKSWRMWLDDSRVCFV